MIVNVVSGVVYFGDLMPSDVFMSSDGRVYMKIEAIEEYNAIDIVTGSLDNFDDTEQVQEFKNAKITLEK